MTSIAFIIPVRNDAERLRRCLETVRANRWAGGRIYMIVADNGSTDGSAEVARAFGASVLLLPELRVSALRNRAAAKAETELLAFVDADHELGPDWVKAAIDVMSESDVGAAGAVYLSPPGGTSTQQFCGALRGRTVGRRETRWLGSGNLVVRRSAFDQLNGFDESLETCEDVDFCQRLRAAGWRLVADEKLVSVHTGDPRSLRELFLSERWRGRDNLRVSFRLRPSLRDAPSIVLPIAGAVFTIVGCAAFVVAVVTGRTVWWLAAATGLVVFLNAAVRATGMIVSRRLSPIHWLTAYGVALAYESGRAASLIWPATHRRRDASPRPLTADGGA